VQTFAGAKTFTNTATFQTDITVNGLTVGRGLGNILSNTAIGAGALSSTTSSSESNTAIGNSAGINLTSGAKNILIGALAGSKISSGTTANTTGLNSVLIGFDVRPLANADNNEIVVSGYNGTGTVGLGSNTTVIGNSSTKKTQIYGSLITVPSAAVSAYASAESSIIEAQGTTGGGAPGNVTLKAGSSALTADGGNIYLTAGTGGSNSAGGNVILTPGTGAATGVAKVVGSDLFVYDNNFRVGRGNKSISGNTALGSQTLNGANSGTGGNTAIGSAVLYTNTTGYANTGVGGSALYYNTTGYENTAIGSNALNKNTEGKSNISLGNGSLSANTTGSYNVAIGNSALSDYSNTSNNVAIGYSSLRYSSAGNNTAIGYAAGGSMGYNGSAAVTGGANNIFLGHQAGNNAGPTSPTLLNSTGYNSVMIGYDVRPKANGDNNEVVISGYNGTAGTVGNGSNTVTIGNSANTANYLNGVTNLAAGTMTNTTGVDLTGSINDFFQYNVKNSSTGTGAQSGYSATANNGTNTTGFAWMGINNSNFNNPQTYNIGGASDVSFLGAGNDMYIANSNSTKSIILSTGTGAGSAPYFNERMRITSTGNVGIGTASPTATFEVNGTSKLGGATTIAGAATFTSTVAITSGAGLGKVLTSDASGNATWKSAVTAIARVTLASAVTTNLTTDQNYYIVLKESVSGQTINLPDATTNTGKEYTIKNLSLYSLNVTATSGKLVQDNTTTDSTTALIGIEPSNNWIKVISDGTDWIIFRALF
jgi:hypothetical protein